MPITFHLEWSQSLNSAGFSLARETGWICTWDNHAILQLLNSRGQRQGHCRFPQPVVQVVLADDGSCLLVAGQRGALSLLTPDFSTIWKAEVEGGILSIALDSLGQAAVAANRQGALFRFDRGGARVARGQSPRPLWRLAMVPTAQQVIGAADFGLVAAFDEKLTISWRETPVTHLGSLAIDGEGNKILVASFSEGITWIDGSGKSQKNLVTPVPCGQVCLSFDGEYLLAGGVGNQVMVLGSQGELLAQHEMADQVQALGYGPLGQEIYAVLAGGTIVKYRLEGLTRR